MTLKQRSRLFGLVLLLAVILAVMLSGCGPSHYLKKAERALKKAEQLGADISSDTAWKVMEVPVPVVKTDTLFESQPWDTVRIEKDRLKIKYVNLPGDSVYIYGESKADTVKLEVPVNVYREISAGYTLGELIILAIAALAVGYIVRVIVQMIRR